MSNLKKKITVRRINLRREVPLKPNILVYRPKGGQNYKKLW